MIACHCNSLNSRYTHLVCALIFSIFLLLVFDCWCDYKYFNKFLFLCSFSAIREQFTPIVVCYLPSFPSCSKKKFSCCIPVLNTVTDHFINLIRSCCFESFVKIFNYFENVGFFIKFPELSFKSVAFLHIVCSKWAVRPSGDIRYKFAKQHIRINVTV
jgi:hypothetical protein